VGALRPTLRTPGLWDRTAQVITLAICTRHRTYWEVLPSRCRALRSKNKRRHAQLIEKSWWRKISEVRLPGNQKASKSKHTHQDHRHANKLNLILPYSSSRPGGKCCPNVVLTTEALKKANGQVLSCSKAGLVCRLENFPSIDISQQVGRKSRRVMSPWTKLTENAMLSFFSKKKKANSLGFAQIWRNRAPTACAVGMRQLFDWVQTGSNLTSPA